MESRAQSKSRKYQNKRFMIMSQSTSKLLLSFFFIALSGLILISCSQTAAASIHALSAAPSPDISPSATSAQPITPTPQATAIPTKYTQPAEVKPTAEGITENNLALPTENVLPSEHYILKISGHKQYFSIGCEASAAVDWAAYFGVHINEFNFQYEMPLSDNPDYGFVGDVKGPWGQVPPYAYGVYAGPVAAALQKHGLPAKGIKAFTIGQIKSEIAMDHPVIAWVIGNVVGGVPTLYTDSQGRKTIVAAYEHVVIVTGYNDKKIRYMTNGKFFETPIEVFQNSWNVLENMVVFWSK
jgi:uncharacterized protein YvpB